MLTIIFGGVVLFTTSVMLGCVIGSTICMSLDALLFKRQAPR